MDKELRDIVGAAIEESSTVMDETPYEVTSAPSKDPMAGAISDGEAIDIQYNCPKCGNNIRTTWLFPDATMTFRDECCNMMVSFEGRDK